MKRPEQGIKHLYRSKGYQAFFTENFLWNGFFGLLFWEELFENENSAVYNPFDRLPSGLVAADFYQKNQDLVESKLKLLQSPKCAERHLLQILSRHYGKLNDIFKWHPNLIRNAVSLLRASEGKDLAHIFRTMAQKFQAYHSGYPDLMVIKDQVASFIEVKAEGDSLRSQQLSKVKLLSEAGFAVQNLKVKWQSDPNQIYVVVDLETTGGSAAYHRVTEIGAVKIKGHEIIDEFQTLINPGRPIPKNITQVTGITNEMVFHAPQFSDVADKFDEFTKGAIFVAHNARFDYGFIQREFQRLEKPYVRPQICTVQAMRKSFPGLKSYSLSNLTQHFRTPLEQHHRALCDAKAAAELLFLASKLKSPQCLHYELEDF